MRHGARVPPSCMTRPPTCSMEPFLSRCAPSSCSPCQRQSSAQLLVLRPDRRCASLQDTQVRTQNRSSLCTKPTQVREFIRALPPEQLRLLRAEDWQAYPRKTLDELHGFFLSSSISPGASHVVNEPLPTQEPEQPHLSHDVYSEVDGFYDEFNRELAHLADGEREFIYT